MSKKIEDFNNSDIESLNKAVVDVNIKRFATNNAYSAFQLARLLKRTSVTFEDFFDVRLLGWGLKAKIKVFISAKVVNHDNKEKLAAFAAKYYNPIEHNDSNGLIVVKSGVADARDIDSSANTSVVFYSNIRNYGLVNTQGMKIIGFSADTSIFNSSKDLRKQIRIAKKTPKKKASVFEEHTIEELSNVLFGNGQLKLSHIYGILKNKDVIAQNKNMPFLEKLKSNGMDKKINGMIAIMDSMTREEAENQSILRTDKVRRRRLVKGSHTSEALLDTLLDIYDYLSKNNIIDVMKNMMAVNPAFKQIQGAFDKVASEFKKK